MSTSGRQDGAPRRESALESLVNREEVLQICYWYQGEGFGDVYTPLRLAPFLACPEAAIEAALDELAGNGLLEPAPGADAGYRLTEPGKREAGRLFADAFADYQKPGHGECVDGCCEDDDHSRCGDNCTLH